MHVEQNIVLKKKFRFGASCKNLLFKSQLVSLTLDLNSELVRVRKQQMLLLVNRLDIDFKAYFSRCPFQHKPSS